MKVKKKKYTVRIIPPHSEHYVSIDDKVIDFQQDNKQYTPKQKSIDRKLINDLKNIHRYKLNSKNIQLQQSHSPIYE